MTKNHKIVMAVAVFVILTGAVYCFEYFRLQAVNKNKQAEINSFAACASAGNPIMESYPEQCRTADGRTFTRPLSAEEQSKLKPLTENCKKLGEIPQDLDQGILNPSFCCAGLKPILRSSAFNADCVGAWGGSNPYLCLACGDNICDANYESKCNCPADCSTESPLAQAEWTNSADGKVSVRFVADKTVVVLNEKILVRCAVRNNSNKPILILRPFGDGFYALSSGLRITGPAGKVAYRGPMKEYALGGSSFYELQAGEIIEEKFELSRNHLPGLSQAGAFKIQYNYISHGYSPRPKPENFWAGEIESKSIDILVTGN